MPREKHVTVAWGRDYGDVAPLQGVMTGGGSHTLTVSVDVEPNPEPVKSRKSKA
jgi:transglutaminase-like putative cysteine protease